jgi:hypothetical protein
MRLHGWLCLALLWPRLTFGQEAASGTARARVHFEEGLSHAQRGDLEIAIKAFEAAYAARPHYSVLYNIAQAQSALGRNVQAVATFERYLREGGAQISDSRREEVEALIETNRRRTGSLRIKAAAPDRTRVWLDGAELRREELDAPIPLTAGQHALLYSNGSGYPVPQEVTIAAGATRELLLPAGGNGSPRALEQIVVQCDVPAVTVTIDGVIAGKTPFAHPLLVTSGARIFAFTRTGYTSAQRTVNVQQGSVASVGCGVRPEPRLSPSQAAVLRVRPSPASARVLLNGEALVGGALPAGEHELRVEHDGYLPYRKTISLSPGTNRGLDIALLPTPAQRERTERAKARRSTLGYVLGGTGAALLLSAGGLLLWNNKRYDEWQPTEANPLKADRVASIQRIDDLSLGLALAGVGFLGGGAWLLLTPPSSDER